MNKHTCARHCTRPSRGQVTQRAPLPPVLPASVCTAPDWPTGVWLGSEGLPSHPGLQGSRFPVCVVVILALGGLKEVEMCCEGPEAVPPGHLLCWLLGPRRLPLRCPGWLRVSAPHSGGQAGMESGARPGLACLAQLLSGPALALWFPCCPWGWFDSLPLTFPLFLMWCFHAHLPLGML